MGNQVEDTLNARICVRRDITANWELVSSSPSPFVPLLGEILVYTDHGTKTDEFGQTVYIPGIKIGDGVHAVDSLPFVADDAIDGVRELLDGKADKVDTILDGSLSMGRKPNTTVGEESTALGYDVEASGDFSFATGTSTTATGPNAHAEGANTTAAGQWSHAEGGNTNASGEGSHAEGTDTVAYGTDAHAEGEGTIATGSYSHVSGRYNKADSYRDWPEWQPYTRYEQGQKVKRTIVVGEDEIVIGYICRLTNMGNQFVESDWINANNRMNYAEIVGNGTSDMNRSNARTLDWDGNERLSGNILVNCSGSYQGDYVVTEQTANYYVINDNATGRVSNRTWSVEKITDMLETKANKTDTVLNTTLSRGRDARSDTGVASIAFGKVVVASGEASQAFGWDTIAEGDYSTAKGYATVASGAHSSVSGVCNVIDSFSNVAEWTGNTQYFVGDERKITTDTPETEELVTTQNISDDFSRFETDFSAFSIGDTCKITGSVAYHVGSGILRGITDITNTFVITDTVCSYTIGSWTVIIDLAGPKTLSFKIGNNYSYEMYAMDDNPDGFRCIGIRKVTPATHIEEVYRCKSPHLSAQTFIGEYWEEISYSHRYAEIVGNGDNNLSRSNARALDWWGNEHLLGDLYVHCKPDSTGGKRVVAEDEVNRYARAASPDDIQAIIDGYGEDLGFVVDAHYDSDSQCFVTEDDAEDLAEAFRYGYNVVVHFVFDEAVATSGFSIYSDMYSQMICHETGCALPELMGGITLKPNFTFANGGIATGVHSLSEIGEIFVGSNGKLILPVANVK